MTSPLPAMIQVMEARTSFAPALSTPAEGTNEARRFEAIYGEHFGSINANARRRLPARADDVVAETFLVVWRRLDEIPADALPWLYGVARRVVSDFRRSAQRQEAVAERDDREPTPAAVLAELRRLATEEPLPGGLGEIEAEGLVRLAAFDTGSGRATIYAAPLQASSGFCSVVGDGEEIGGGACSDGRDGKAIPYIGQWSSGWGDVHFLVGALEAPAARIELRFEDGALRAASTHAPWWVYVVGGDETEPGHRPVELTALDPGGAVLAKQAVDPYYYTSRRAAQALLRESDGSPRPERHPRHGEGTGDRALARAGAGRDRAHTPAAPDRDPRGRARRLHGQARARPAEQDGD